MIDELGSQVEALLDARAWTRARWVIEERLQDEPHDHRLVAQLALTWLGELRLAEARGAIDRAAMLAPECPEVLCIRGAVLDALGETEKAVAVLSALTERGAHALTRGECRIEKPRARAVVADALIRLARLHEIRGEYDQQAVCTQRHLVLTAAGTARTNTLVPPGVGAADAIWHRLRGPEHEPALLPRVH